MESDLGLHRLPMSHKKDASQLIKATIENHYMAPVSDITPLFCISCSKVSLFLV